MYRSITMIHGDALEPRKITGDFDNKMDAIKFKFKAERQVVPNKNEWLGYSKVLPLVKCYCGAELECEHYTNECSCGRYYNFNGSILAHRSQWGEETGEHWSEII